MTNSIMVLLSLMLPLPGAQGDHGTDLFTDLAGRVQDMAYKVGACWNGWYLLTFPYLCPGAWYAILMKNENKGRRKKMNIVCLDLEGVLVPEIWIAFAEESGIPELKRTTRDEPDYDKLMHWRLGILKEHGLGLKEIQETIAKIDPIPGAKEFLDQLRNDTGHHYQ